MTAANVESMVGVLAVSAPLFAPPVAGFVEFSGEFVGVSSPLGGNLQSLAILIARLCHLMGCLASGALSQ
jgi:hypothetical protein